ncbi:hypothetical protein [Bradyrhizobium sp. I71]|uniref:hypothetical protein n=1 Tax=Bradyrhizobium sp. I71 TaxID=2590772 RepID=UPI001EF98EF7|nr:hypothetical protein [Bradyrhizobium sp. I71]ULK99659.1 hypothetical protein FJV43_07965 [Bradyrhizobium sp. I71]
MSFSIDEGLNDNTKALAASSCDYVQDLMDLDDVPMSSRLRFAKEPDGILPDLRENGASVFSATRNRKFRNDSWGDAPALEMTVGYSVIGPADRQLTQLYIPRRARLA